MGSPSHVPITQEGIPDSWSELTAAQKRGRVLAVAGDLFSREGVEFPMPDLARAVGVGVGSIYRQLGKKEDVIAALVITRLDGLSERYRSAIQKPDLASELRCVMITTVRECVGDRVTQAAWTYGRGRPDVDAAAARARDALEALVRACIERGLLREDATGDDLRYLFRAAPGAELIAPGGAERLAHLTLSGLLR